MDSLNRETEAKKKLRFSQAIDKIVYKERALNGIGTLSEKTMHAVVKNYIEPNEDYHEVPVNGFVADIFRDNKIYEIQTANFNTMRRKLDSFLPEFEVTIIYPIPATKYLSWIDEETGEVVSRRKSPKRGVPQSAFRELYKIKQYLDHPNLNIELLMIDTEESRLLNGWSKDRKKGSVRHDRIPTALVESYLVESPRDYLMFVPPTLDAGFSTKGYAKASHIPLGQAQTALNILNYLNVVKRIGKNGNAFLYDVEDS